MSFLWRPSGLNYLDSPLGWAPAVLSHVSLFVALPRLDFLQEVVKQELSRGFPEKKIQEAVLQTYLFVGFPRTINAFTALSSLWKTPPEAFEVHLDPEIREKRGRAFCRQIYRENYEKLLSQMERLHPDLKRYMIEEGYGKILAREGLSPLEREFGILPILLCLEVERQLHSHLLGTYYLGASFVQLELLFYHLEGPLSSEKLASGLALLTTLKGKYTCTDIA
jgi:alkylhydroperoxidase/carboxymuconolactone decarboxylase family protein YurZ